MNRRWIKAIVLTALGGAITSSFAALIDHRYNFPKDLGSGKMWEFFIQGALVTGGALLVQSPIQPKGDNHEEDK